MRKHCVSLILVIFLMNSSLAAPVRVGRGPDDKPATVAKVKEKVTRSGTGKRARVTVKMRNGQAVKGYISQAGENDFVIKDSKSDASTTVTYSEVSDVKSHRGVSKWVWVGVGAGAAVVVLAIAVAASLHSAGYTIKIP